MKKNNFKLENLEIYTYFLLSILIAIISIYFYSFVQQNVYETIISNNVELDATTIRISDVNINKFEKVTNDIEKKSSSKEVKSRNIFN